MEHKFKVSAWILSFVFLLTLLPTQLAFAAGPALSADEQWIEGVSTAMEYITEETYLAHGGAAANNPYWTSLSGGTRPDGTKYSAFTIVNGKLSVASAWYGENVYLRAKGSSGAGTIIEIPEYSQLKTQYKRVIRVFNAYSPDTGQSFYDKYLTSISDSNGFLNGAAESINVKVTYANIENFNKVPNSYLTDAEGNYIYDLVAVGAYTGGEPDLSGAAAWALQAYIKEGYGFLIGHDTMYGYGGISDNPNYVPDKNSTTTSYYIAGTNQGGHYNMNWLMGCNKWYKQADNPNEANSLILPISDYRDKSSMFGSPWEDDLSILRVIATANGNPSTDIAARCPTNYPFTVKADGKTFGKGTTFAAGVTHSNMQIAYGKVWIDFEPSIAIGIPVTDTSGGYNGTNNFYLTTNGNFGMMQIGHLMKNLTGTTTDECRILANTVLYLSQRQPCEVCQSKQGGNAAVHAVRRIYSVDELAKIGTDDFLYPLDGCYVLMKDIQLPTGWKPIAGLSGHFNADGHQIDNGEQAVFARDGKLGANESGWNLGTDATKGINQISNANGSTTGVARVSGFLNPLFGTDSSTDYSGYRIEIKGTDGKTYDCVTNREGKYVLSNLPCTGVMNATVTTPKGVEVTEYGVIYADIPSLKWNSNETVPLQCRELQLARALPNQTTLEDDTAVFTAQIDTTSLPEKAVWQFNDGSSKGWQNVSDSPLFNASATSCKMVNADPPYAETKLTLKEVPLGVDGYHFRCVFTLNGKIYATSDAEVLTEDTMGLLTVIERTYTITAVPDVSAWQGQSASLVATFTYYRKLGEEITVRWQYRSGDGFTWEDVNGSKLVTNFTVTNTATTGAESLNKSVLKLNAVSNDINGYQFRAVFEYAARGKTFTTSEIAAPGKQGKVSVTPQTASCVTQPSNLKLELSGSTVPGTHSYTSEFLFTSQSKTTTVTWEYKENAAAAYKPISGLSCASVVNGTPTSNGSDTYRIKTTLNLKNSPSSLDMGTSHYYFRAKITVGDIIVYSGGADISYNYKIDVKPGAPVVQISADGKTKIYTYPNLMVYAPEGVRVMQVQFDTGSIDAKNTMSSVQSISGITAMTGNVGFQYNSATALTAAQVQAYLRQVKITVGTANADVKWFVGSERFAGDYDPYSGKYYEYVASSGITWTQSYEAARSRYNSVLQAGGQLATIRTDAQQSFVKTLVGGKTAWLGATSNASYNGGTSAMRWVDGTSLSYSKLSNNPSGTYYVQMRPDGSWYAGTNTNNVTVSVKDLITYSSGSLGGWARTSGTTGAMNAEGTSGATGINFTIPTSGTTTLSQNLNLVAGHQYWVYGRVGEEGNQNGNLSINTPWGSFHSYANGSGTYGYGDVNSVFTASSTGSYPVTVSTRGVSEAAATISIGGYSSASLNTTVNRQTINGSAITIPSQYQSRVRSVTYDYSIYVGQMTGGFGVDGNVGGSIIGTPAGALQNTTIWGYGTTSGTNTVGNLTGLTNIYPQINNWASAVTYSGNTTISNVRVNIAGDTLYGQLYHLEVVDLTASFGAAGASIPNATWMKDNVGVFNGTKSLNVTSNQSAANGYVVEYLVNDKALEHSEKTASAKDKLPGVKAGELPSTQPRTADFRTDTDVILSCGVTALEAVNPENPARVTFTVQEQNGTIKTLEDIDICVPAGGSERAYVPYHVPDAEGTIVVTISTSDNLLSDTSTITATVEKIADNPPPDPKATDRNDGFTVPTTPTFTNATSHTWTTFDATKVDDEWQYVEVENKASLVATLQIQPDAEVPTAVDKNMKSGYGVNANVTARMTGSGVADTIPAQTVISYFPEFKYQSYWRLLTTVNRTQAQSQFQFRTNPYSNTDTRVHFLPVWYPDKQYTVYAILRDVWTPVGELKQAVTDAVQVKDSVFDDWYIVKSGS